MNDHEQMIENARLDAVLAKEQKLPMMTVGQQVRELTVKEPLPPYLPCTPNLGDEINGE